ncbi:MAG: oligosaccharide flippase family protein [Candidatus Omnitrophica bacterium]|nr:oligosaccharide flippase family protein [Candidatus Omnitrophota bacterium]
MTSPPRETPKNFSDQLIRNSGSSFVVLLGGRFALTLLSVLGVALTTRLLGVAGFGRWSMYLAVIYLVWTALTAWNYNALFRYGLEEYQQTRSLQLSFWTRNSILFPLLLLAIFALVKFEDPIQRYIGAPIPWLWILLGSLALIAKEISGTLLQACGRLRTFGIVDVAEKLLFVTGIVLVLFFKPDSPLMMVVGISILATAAVSIGILVSLSKFLGKPKTTRAEIIRHLRFSWPYIFQCLINTYVLNWVHLWLLRLWMDEAAVGIFALAYRAMSLTQNITTALQTLISPVVISWKTEGQTHRTAEFVRVLVPQMAFLWMSALSLAILFSPEICLLLGGPEFRRAGPPLGLLLIALLPSFLGSMYFKVLLAEERSLHIFLVNLGGSLVTIGASIFLIPRLGVYGSVAGVLLGFLTIAILSALAVSKTLPLRFGFPGGMALVPGAAFLAIVSSSSPQRILLSTLTLLLWVLLFKRLRIFAEKDILRMQQAGVPKIWCERVCRTFMILRLLPRQPCKNPEL